MSPFTYLMHGYCYVLCAIRVSPYIRPVPVHAVDTSFLYLALRMMPCCYFLNMYIKCVLISSN